MITIHEKTTKLKVPLISVRFNVSVLLVGTLLKEKAQILPDGCRLTDCRLLFLSEKSFEAAAAEAEGVAGERAAA